ncbi:MAG: hypothetical protein OHK0040_02000 [bacterium]
MFRLICRKFCTYYREEKEDLGHCFPIKVFVANKGQFLETTKIVTISSKLEDLFCSNCEFYPNDCDYSIDKEAEPCGGYKYYLTLLEEGTLNIDELAKLCDACKTCVSKEA